MLLSYALNRNESFLDDLLNQFPDIIERTRNKEVANGIAATLAHFADPQSDTHTKVTVWLVFA